MRNVSAQHPDTLDELKKGAATSRQNAPRLGTDKCERCLTSSVSWDFAGDASEETSEILPSSETKRS